MSTYDFLDTLDEPRRGVPTYQDLERLTRQGNYEQALSLLKSGTKFVSQLTLPQIRTIRSIALKHSATTSAASLLSYLQENSPNDTFEDILGNDVY